MAEDIIGSLGIQIEADASDLPGQYDAAVSASENAAERIASAFESVVGIGEALAITEGLKEFGTEALNAYGAVQSVTVAMIAMTGSIEHVGEAVEAVKEISATQPFAFPELAATMQRMLALGVQLEEIPLVLQSAANVAAATGNSLAAVGQSIDRMALSGAVAQRQLTQLGLSTQDLAKAMGIAASQVKAAFLAMDESQRLDVLTTALDKFAGAAEAQANTVKGAWQILQNQFEEVMVGVGAALEPAIKDIIDFGTQAVHYAQEAIDAFNKLPEPVKEFSGAVAIAAASIAPLAVAVGTLGLGITGISAALGPIKELFGGFGEAAAEAAVAEGEAATAATAVAEGVGAAGLAFGGVEVVIGAVGAALVGLELKDQVEQWQQVYETLKNNTEVFFTLETGIADVARALVEAAGNSAGFQDSWTRFVNFVKSTPIQNYLGGPLADANNILKGFNQTLQITAGELPAADAMAKQVAASMQALADKTAGAAAQTQIHTEKLTGVQLALNNLGKTTADEAAQVDFWTTAVQQAGAQLDGTAEKAEVYNAALQKLDQATKTLNAGNKDYQDTLAGMTEAFNKQQGVITTLENTLAQLASTENRTDAQETIMVETANKLAAARKAEAQATVTLKAAIDDLPKAYDGLVTSADAFLKKEQDVATAVGYAKSVLDALMASQDTSAEHQRAVTDALNQYVDKLKASGAAMTDQITLTVNGVNVITTLGGAINAVKGSQGDWNTVTVNGVQVLKDHAAAVTNVSTAVRTLGTVIQSTGADTSKAIGYFNPLSQAISDLSGAASEAVDNTSRFGVQISTTSDDASGAVDNMSRFANVIDHVSESSVTAAGKLGNLDNAITKVGASSAKAQAAAKGAGDQFAQTAGDAESGAQGLDVMTQSADALSTALSFLADVSSGITALAGSGSAHDTINSHFVSTFDQISQLNQQQAQAKTGGAALQQQLQQEIDTWFAAQQKQATALAANTTATNTNVTAVNSKTTATTQAASATNSLTTATANLSTAVDAAGNAVTQYNGLLDNSSNTTVDALGNATTVYNTATQAQQKFVDGLGNVYNSYQALADAIKNNPLLQGPATSSGPLQSSTDNSGVVPATTYTIDGKQVDQSDPRLDALKQALALPGKSGSTASVAPTSTQLYSDPTGRFGNITGSGDIVSVQQALALQALAAHAGLPEAGAGITSNPYNYTPSSPGTSPGFGQGTGISGQPLPGTNVTVNLHYPQFNTQQQAQQVMSQMVQQLRTNAGLKL